MEFPRNPTRRQQRQQHDVSIAISGMQDVFLEVSQERVEEIVDADLCGRVEQLPSTEPGFNWDTFVGYMRDL